MVLFIPRSSWFEIGTGADMHAVRRTLEANVSGKVFSLFPHKPFIGFVDDTGFDIKEPSWFARVYVPNFRGSFYETSSGMAVRVRASNGYATLTVVMGWLIAASMLGLTFHRLLNGQYASAVLAIVAAFGFVACAFVTGRFYYHKLYGGRQKLLSILQGHGAENRGRRETVATNDF